MAGSHRVIWLALVCAFTLGFVAVRARGSVPASPSEAFERRRTEARANLIKDQLALATWCNGKELFLERDQIYTRILALEPDNLEARKGLRYGRNPDGSWKDPTPREAKNRNPKALAELPGQRAKSVARYRDAMIDLLASEQAEPALRRAVFDEILTFDPDDARVHEIACETKVGDKWLLQDSVAAKARRAELKALVQAAKDGVPEPTTIEPPAAEKALAEWKSAVGTADMRVLSTGDVEEAQAIFASCMAARALVDALFGVSSRFAEDYAVFVLANPGEKDAFIERLPHLSSEERTFLKMLQSAGVHEDRHVALFDPEPRRRVDNAVRHTLGHLLHSAYEIRPSHGWVWEGVGLYLTRELCGTRLTWFVSKLPDPNDKEAQTLRGVLLNSETNWMNEALKILDGDAPPKLDAVMRADPNTMTMQDMLTAYVLVAYFVEARAGDAGELIRRAGAGVDPVVSVQDVLGLSIPELEERLRRWLKERK